MQPLRVEVPDSEHASSLRSYLQRSGVETDKADDACDVQVDLLALNPESRIVNTLNAIEQWLLTAGLPFVQVHVNGSSYKLHTSPTNEPAR
jgi:hypothetical protein